MPALWSAVPVLQVLMLIFRRIMAVVIAIGMIPMSAVVSHYGQFDATNAALFGLICGMVGGLFAIILWDTF